MTTTFLAVRRLLGLSDFQMVLEEDGAAVSSEVLADIIEEGESLGLLMLLQPGESWTKGC